MHGKHPDKCSLCGCDGKWVLDFNDEEEFKNAKREFERQKHYLPLVLEPISVSKF